MGQEFAHRVDDRNLSWCTFGTWASEGVGGAIRHHQTDKSLVLRTMRCVRRKAYPEIAEAAACAFADGNRAVFDDIGRGFAGFLAAVREDDPAAVDRFLDGLVHALPEAGIDITLEVRLRDGFAAYRDAMATTDRRERAQLICFGNLCMAYVEQVRLQEPIERAFRAVLTGRWADRTWARRCASRIVTEWVLKLEIDQERFRPGWRLPKLHGRRFPPDLDDLDEDRFAPFRDVLPPPRRRLPNSDHWPSLRDRLRYIGALMRSRQQVVALFDRLPFCPPQIDQIDAGRVPLELAVPAGMA
jgi:hypothetical protein